jgi:histidyl-tRNA synthetase
MATTSTKPATGMRDLLPREMLGRERVIETIKSVYRSYGFEPLETPACERLEVLLGKYGEEGDQLVFKIMHRGEKLERALASGAPAPNDLADMALRYDLTVPLARVVAAYQNEIPRYFKRYQIQPVWRADRPQKGRFREFFQCDVDVVGSTSLLVEVEVASAVATVLERLGFAEFRIRLNHRGVVSGLVEVAGVPPSLEGTAITAIDKLDKIGPNGVRTELLGRGVEEEAADRLVTLLGLGEGSNDDAMRRLHEVLAPSAAGMRGVDDLVELLRFAEGSPAAKYLSIDPFLARGLSYYTGPIFEVQVADLAGSLGGGGRYDNLVGMFLGRPIPACGFSLGLERILVVMEERGMFGDAPVGADVMVGVWDDALAGEAVALARDLRAAGLRVDLFPDRDKVGKQMKHADARGFPFVAIVGPDEAAEGSVTVKELATGEQAKVPRGDVAGLLLGKVKK